MERKSGDESEIRKGEVRLSTTAVDGHPRCVKPRAKCFCFFLHQ